ncbi:hypothetical protein R1sor_011936 [Riccia sorocarpa]|uniref:Uncharacterized protein n=1 Tax=Riccia sorocarpa TaxID=122646 RepID=A0ABD3I2C7_9MARC
MEAVGLGCKSLPTFPLQCSASNKPSRANGKVSNSSFRQQQTNFISPTVILDNQCSETHASKSRRGPRGFHRGGIVVSGAWNASGNGTSERWASFCATARSETETLEEASGSTNAEAPVEGSGFQVPPGGCAACGKAEKIGGCNGEGRIQGGIGAVPGFGWWPIKAFRPCPAFVESGGKYRRIGQSLDEVAFGRASAGDDLDISERLKGR